MLIRRKVLFVLSLALSLALVFGVIILIREVRLNTSSEFVKEEDKEGKRFAENLVYPKDLDGKIYLTLKNLVTEEQGIYYLDLKEEKLKELKIANENCYLLGGEISSASDDMLISKTCRLPDGSFDSRLGSANIFNPEFNIMKDGSSDNDFFLKREGAWVSESSYIYKAYKEKGTDFSLSPESWSVWYKERNSGDKFITNGIHPFVSPDGKNILSLNSRGLYLNDIDTGEGALVYTFDFPISMTTQMDLSDNKSKLVVYDESDRVIIVFDILDWQNFSMEETNRIKSERNQASWPKFYSNNRYVVVEEGLLNEVYLVIYDLEDSNKRYPVYDLSDYDHEEMWINDWK